ncbi:hypothetical protein AALO_G00195890 [Alosa alosa]|uniref:Uncharacterized protein n=1 Tax=Alosa alosa TaxID=278164 RepID=A0AAV6G6H0_9TELE|nr:hypothetical protein AALO_G00195890 [Alosa alosa]
MAQRVVLIHMPPYLTWPHQVSSTYMKKSSKATVNTKPLPTIPPFKPAPTRPPTPVPAINSHCQQPELPFRSCSNSIITSQLKIFNAA